MTDCIVTTAGEAANLPTGQWVVDADSTVLCLVDTNVGWPQRMWMGQGGRSYAAIDQAAYPLRLADLDEGETPCPHSWGTNECGHCRRCGAVVAPAKDLVWNLTAVHP